MFKYFHFFSLLLLTSPLFSQTHYIPTVKRKTQKNVYIKSVVIHNTYTAINFYFTNASSSETNVWLNSPGQDNAFYIRADGEYYRLLNTYGIGDQDDKTLLEPGQSIEFSATFDKIPSGTTSFDLIEGDNGTWNFFGVNLGDNNSSSTKTYSYPDVNRQTQSDLKIKSVVINSFNTTINFYYKNTKSDELNIWLHDPGEDDAYYILADGVRYSLISTSGIGNQYDKTPLVLDEHLEFSAKFETIPSGTTSFDLIEGDNGTWNFYGVRLRIYQESSNLLNTVKFKYAGEWKDYYSVDGNIINKLINNTWKNMFMYDYNDGSVKVASNGYWVKQYLLYRNEFKKNSGGIWEYIFVIDGNYLKVPNMGSFEKLYWLDGNQIKKQVDGKWTEFGRLKGNIDMYMLAIIIYDWTK